MRNPRDPDEKTGLKHTGALGVAELERRSFDLARAVHATKRRCRNSEPVQEVVRLCLVVGTANRVGARDQHGHREPRDVLRQALEVER